MAVPHFSILIVDTTAIVADYRLRSAQWQLVCAESAAGLRRVIVPEVVVREATNRFATDAAKARTQIASATHVLRRLGATAQDGPPEENDADRYASWLRAALAAANVEIWPLPNDGLSDLLDRVITRTPPVKPSGAGAGDALVWDAVRNACQSTIIGKVAFVSGNATDFAKDGQLRPELAAEMVKGTSSSTAELFPTLGDFMQTQLIEDPARQAAALNLAAQLLREDRGSVLECLRYAAYDATVRVTDAISQVQFVPTDVREVLLLGVDVSTVEGLPDAWAVARFRATVRGDLELYGVAPHLNMGDPIHVDRVVDFVMSFEAIVDLHDGTLDNFASADEIEVEFSDYATVW
ncbi:PIN domain-containing protein [Ilumatobacter nonamiensis]|uniref:PIN domain-containing protein n=1 Tax=Ilumatobacter nonamiensis TaxID=467093 RepID=UPI000348B063|nr:PIN domain-containing protein [Ilumatobacter nonamiensis]